MSLFCCPDAHKENLIEMIRDIWYVPNGTIYIKLNNITYKLYNEVSQTTARDSEGRDMAARDIESILQDLTGLDWSESAVSSATGGSYLKARQGEGADATYYKLSCYDEVSGIYGHECLNELIAARLMDVLCIEHVPYRLVHARVIIDGHKHETWLSESRSFRKVGESKTSLAKFFSWNRLEDESRLEFCDRFGWLPAVQKMMLLDFLIANRDRHGGNIEVLKRRDGSLRLAPLFDNGTSLCFSTYSAQQLSAIDPLQDIATNNYLGTHSLEQNLVRFVPRSLPVGRLRAEHRGELLEGLTPAAEGAVEGVGADELLDFLWRMIWERWCRYEDLRDSGRLQAQG